MNIFVLEYTESNDQLKNNIDWAGSAVALDNKRLNKMIIESLQMLSAALKNPEISFTEVNNLYRRAYINHPCTLWVSKCLSNFQALTFYTKVLCETYVKRFNRHHSGEVILKEIEKVPIYHFETKFLCSEPTLPPLLVSDNYKISVTTAKELVEAYRNYYCDKDIIYYYEEDIPGWFLEKRHKPYKVYINKRWETVYP